MAITKLNERQLHIVGNDNLATDSELSDAIVTHTNELNPHSQYLNTINVTGTLGLLKKVSLTQWALDNSQYYTSGDGIPWSSITGTPEILPSLVSAVQVVPATGTTIIAFDNTPPLISEGTEIARVTYAPSNPLSKLIIQGSLPVNSSTSNRNIIIALFKGSTCIGASALNVISSGRPQIFDFIFTDLLLGDNYGLASVVYSVRIGVASAATWYVNKHTTNVFNGLMESSSIIFSEYM